MSTIENPEPCDPDENEGPSQGPDGDKEHDEPEGTQHGDDPSESGKPATPPRFVPPAGLDPSILRIVQERANIAFRIADAIRPFLEQREEVARTLARLAQSDEVARTVARLTQPNADFQRQIAALSSHKIDYSHLFDQTMLVQQVLASMPKFDLSGIIESLGRWMPPNWDDSVDVKALEKIINEDGLPVVWVPRSEVLNLVIAAPNRQTRVQVLLDHRDVLVEDCRSVLKDVTRTEFAGQIPLATAALDALGDGHPAPAQALSVAVTETVVTRVLGRRYDRVAKLVLVDDLDDISLVKLRTRAALAPIHRFYTAWWANSGVPVPEELSRHVSVHHADVVHYNDGNALVAVLLMTSVLRAMQEYQESDLAEDED